jgi:hypothetical protein
MVRVGTLPYYRTYQFHTINPILRIAACTTRPGGSANVVRLLVRWRTRKLAELQFISIAVGRFIFFRLKASHVAAPHQLSRLINTMPVRDPCRRRYWIILLEFRLKCLLACVCTLALQPCTFNPWHLACCAANHGTQFDG